MATNPELQVTHQRATHNSRLQPSPWEQGPKGPPTQTLVKKKLPFPLLAATPVRRPSLESSGGGWGNPSVLTGGALGPSMKTPVPEVSPRGAEGEHYT
jgi:hypothetical protein